MSRTIQQKGHRSPLEKGKRGRLGSSAFSKVEIFIPAKQIVKHFPRSRTCRKREPLLRWRVQLVFVFGNLAFPFGDTPPCFYPSSRKERASARELLLQKFAVFGASDQMRRQKVSIRVGKPKLTEEQVTELKRKVGLGVSKTRVAKDFGITREKVYQYLKDRNQPSCYEYLKMVSYSMYERRR